MSEHLILIGFIKYLPVHNNALYKILIKEISNLHDKIEIFIRDQTSKDKKLA